MRRHPKLIPFSKEHRDKLILAQVLRSDVPAYKGLPESLEDKQSYLKLQWKNWLAAHMDREEEALFASCGDHPALKEMVKELKEDHQQIRAQVQNLLETTELKPEAFDQLAQTLIRHVRTEERKLFETMQKVLDMAFFEGL